MANTFVSQGKIITAFKHHTLKMYVWLEIYETIISTPDVGPVTFTLAAH